MNVFVRIQDIEGEGGFPFIIDGNVISCKNYRKEKEWSFDYIFSGEESAPNFMKTKILDEEKASQLMFLYGQTSAGKTYTLSGLLNELDLSECKFSCYELYMEEIRDLLANEKITLRRKDGKAFPSPLSIEPWTKEAFDKAMRDRRTGATLMNSKSSRSHMIFIIYHKDGRKHTFIDLAGSERQKTTGAEGERLKEAAATNVSLLQLGIVIRGLEMKEKYVPFRSSVLTSLLEESLLTCNITVIICLPQFNEEESYNSLKFGASCKNVQPRKLAAEELSYGNTNELAEKFQEQISLLKSDIDSRIEKMRGVLSQYD